MSLPIIIEILSLEEKTFYTQLLYNSKTTRSNFDLGTAKFSKTIPALQSKTKVCILSQVRP